MTATKKTARGLIAALIILSFAILSLSSCSLSGDFVASRLEELGVPAFKHSKLKSVEVLYRDYYILDMPASEELAPLVAEHYFENYHEKIDTQKNIGMGFIIFVLLFISFPAGVLMLVDRECKKN